jgi:hypothetical protein
MRGGWKFTFCTLHQSSKNNYKQDSSPLPQAQPSQCLTAPSAQTLHFRDKADVRDSHHHLHTKNLDALPNVPFHGKASQLTYPPQAEKIGSALL